MSIVYDHIALRATTYSIFIFYKDSYLSKKINYICLNKGTEGKHALCLCLIILILGKTKILPYTKFLVLQLVKNCLLVALDT